MWDQTKKFPDVSNEETEPYLVMTTYSIIRLADTMEAKQEEKVVKLKRTYQRTRKYNDGEEYRQSFKEHTKLKTVFQRDRWRIIVTDESHTYRNCQTASSVALLRLCIGKKATQALRDRLQKKRAAYNLASELTSNSRKSFSELLIPCSDEGSPASFRLFLSGTFLVNSIIDLLIHAMIINCKIDSCPNHNNETHNFNDERYWRECFFPLLKDRQKDDVQMKQKSEEIYREFINEFFISFNEDRIAEMLNLPPRKLYGPITLKLDPKSDQGKAYDCVAHTFIVLSKLYEDKQTQKTKLSEIRRHIIVCMQFLTMLGLHPACIKAELSRPSYEISKSGKLLLEAYAEHGFSDMPYQKKSVKIVEILRILRNQIWKNDPQAKVIIFSGFKSFLDILAWHLNREFTPATTSRYYGVRGINKTDELMKFKNGPAKILLTVFKTGGLGLNLTEATHVIMCEPPFTHADWIQAICRMYRIGQTKQVCVYDLVIDGGIDVWRMSKNTYKFGLQQKFKEKPTGVIENRLSMEDTRKIYELLVSRDENLDESTKKKLENKQQEIIKLHVKKLAQAFESAMDDNDRGDVEISDNDDDDDDYFFEFDEEPADEEKKQPFEIVPIHVKESSIKLKKKSDENEPGLKDKRMNTSNSGYKIHPKDHPAAKKSKTVNLIHSDDEEDFISIISEMKNKTINF